MTRDVEDSGQQARNEASVCGQHLVGVDHRESVAQCHDDLGFHPGKRVRQHNVLGGIDQRLAVRAIVPMDAKEIAGICTVRIDPGNLFSLCRQARRRIGQVSDARQLHAERPQMSHVPSMAVPIDDLALESWCHVRPILVGSPSCRAAVPAMPALVAAQLHKRRNIICWTASGSAVAIRR